MTRQSFNSFWLIALALVLGFTPDARAVAIHWVTVAGAGNSCSAQPEGCFGAVASDYRMGELEVSNDQYVEFLNSVAKTDTHALYNPNMGNPALNIISGHGGIVRSGSSGNFTYGAIAGRGDMPVNWVSFQDAMRFANWLHNGQPTGEQSAASTEDGAYTITATGITNNSITRNAGASIFLPSQDEWFKAAYYNVISTSYFDYPANSNLPTSCAAPGALENTANCGGAVGDVVGVGGYSGARSPNGTLDQGGNVSEWNEQAVTLVDVGLGSAFRGVRGGSFNENAGSLAAANRIFILSSAERADTGFRVASVPEPGTALLLSVGLVALSVRKHS